MEKENLEILKSWNPGILESWKNVQCKIKKFYNSEQQTVAMAIGAGN